MTPSRLLVSVRSADEALAAIRGGADLVDVKEPTRGPLGAADDEVIRDVVAAVAGRVPVSAALGEFAEWAGGPVPPGVAFVKWGPARLVPPVRPALAAMRAWSGGGQPVAVAYADHVRANCPEPALIADLARQLRFAAVLVDTAVKDGSTLRDWMPLDMLGALRRELAAAGVRLALAGSLGVEDIRALAPLAPDWFAVRGAACDGGRTGRVCAERVRTLRDVIALGSTRRAS